MKRMWYLLIRSIKSCRSHRSSPISNGGRELQSTCNHLCTFCHPDQQTVAFLAGPAFQIYELMKASTGETRSAMWLFSFGPWLTPLSELVTSTSEIDGSCILGRPKFVSLVIHCTHNKSFLMGATGHPFDTVLLQRFKTFLIMFWHVARPQTFDNSYKFVQDSTRLSCAEGT